ncbi:MAG: family transporter [Moraxellaceae bacterium]|jgi:predicted PurR-regulated permease PerM|nr:family transporter [Moraxellaceae bacterium]
MTDNRPWLWLLMAATFCVLLYLLSPILMPFAAGALLAYLGNPLVERLMRLGLSRNWSVSLTFFTLLSVVVVVLIILTPILWKQLLYIEAKLPTLLRWINREAAPWLERHLHISIDRRIDMNLVGDWLSGYWTEAGAVAGNVLSQVAASSLSILSLLGTLALVPVVTFYLLLDWDVLLRRIRDLLPRHVEPTVSRLARECDDVLAAFLRGQLLVMVSLGVVYAVGLEIVGLKLALIIGLAAGLGSIIPYFGFAIGIVAATIAAIVQFGNFNAVLLVWGVFAVGQAIEGWVLQPYLVGDRIGLHPVAVIFAIMAGGQLFGFVGMLLALPVAAVVMVLLRHGHALYQQSTLYQGMPPALIKEVEDADAEV